MTLRRTEVIVHDDALIGDGVTDPYRRALTIYTADGQHVATIDTLGRCSVIDQIGIGALLKDGGGSA